MRLPGGRLLLLAALLVLGTRLTTASNSARKAGVRAANEYAQDERPINANNQPMQRAKPFEGGKEYIYAYDSQIATGLDTNGIEQGEPQQKAMSRVQTQAQITFKAVNEASLRLHNTRVGQLNKHIEQPEQVQLMQIFDAKKVHEEQARQLALPVRFDYERGLVKNIRFHPDDRPWSKNLKRSVLNLIQVNIKDEQQREQSLEQYKSDKDDGQTKSFAIQETTIEGNCQTIYTINKHQQSGEQVDDQSGEKGREQHSFNVTKSVNFKKCKKIADIGYGYQTEQEQAECAKCQEEWYKLQSRQGPRQELQGACEQCDPKEIKEQRLARGTVVRFTLTGKPQQFGIQRAELTSQYVYKTLRAQNSPYSASLQAIASAQLVFRRAQETKEKDSNEDKEQQQQMRQLRADPKANSLLYDNEWDVDEKRFYMDGDEEFLRNSPFANVQNKVEQAQQTIRKLVVAAGDIQNGVEFETLAQLQKLVELFRMCSVEELKEIGNIVNSDNKPTSLRSGSERSKALQIIADALAIAGTRNTIYVLSEKINNEQLLPAQALQSLKSLTGLVAPSDKQVDMVQNLCQSHIAQRSPALRQTCWLTFGSMVAELCQKEQRKTLAKINKNNNENDSQEDSDSQQKSQSFGTQSGFEPKQQMCRSEKKKSYKEVLEEQYAIAQTTYEKLLALKALGNAGIDTSIGKLEAIAKDRRADPFVRCQAVDAMRRLRTQMPRKIHRCLLPIFTNTKDHQTVRMCAFNLLMHTQPDTAVVDQIAYTLIKESNPQVQAFVYSGMKALSKSKVPCQQQMAKQLKNVLKLANIDEQSLRASRKYQLPLYNDEEQEGLVFDVATIFNGRGILPNYISASMDTLLNGQYDLSQIRISAAQKDFGHWYEQLTRALSQINSQRRSSQMRSERPSSSFGSRYSDPEGSLDKIRKDLNIRRRRRQSEGKQGSQERDEEDQEQHTYQDAFGMICIRMNDVDQVFIPLDRSTMPRPLKSLLNGQKPSLDELIKVLQGGKQFRMLTAMNLNEKTAKIPTSVGMPLRVQQSTPLMVSLDGELKASYGQEQGAKASLNVQSSMSAVHVQKMECWMPIMTTGAMTTQAIEMSAPIDAEIKTEQKGIKLTLKTPQAPKTRLFGMHSLPSTYTVEWDDRLKMQREPKMRAIHNAQLEQLQREVDKTVGEHSTGLPLRMNGHYHRPASYVDYKQAIQLLMATENHLHVTFEPKDGTPTEVVLRASASAFKKTDRQEHSPDLGQFYANDRPSFERNDEDGEFENMDDEEQSRSKLDKFFGGYRSAQAYQHQLTLSAETQGGRKECRAEARIKGSCDAAFKYCKASVDVERTAILADEADNGNWKMRTSVQVLRPDSVKNVQELEKLERGDQNAKFVLQAETEWGSAEKQQVKVRVQGQKAQTQEHRSRFEDYSSVERRYQQKRAAFINQFDVVAEYQLHKSAQNTANRALEMLKNYYLWNTETKLRETGQDGQMKATVFIDPIGQKHANITVKTPSESVRFQTVRMPIPLRPFPLVRRASQSSHSAGQFLQRVTAAEQSRAECIVDNKKVETFDGSAFTASLGPCYSVLAKDCRSQKPSFAVMMKSMGENTQNRKLLVITQDKAIECQPVKVDNGKTKLQCSINGEQVNNDDDSSGQQTNRDGNKVVEYTDAEQTEAEIRVQGVAVRLACWCRNCQCQRASIRISEEYKQGQCGLCGHYDDEAENDLRMGNDQQTSDLAAFHRSYSFVDDDCTTADRQHFYDTKGSGFKPLEQDSHVRNRKHALEDRDEDEQREEEWRAGHYASDESQSSEETQSKARRQRAVALRRPQTNDKQQRKGNGQQPIEQTKVIEYSHKVCFSKEPVKQCPRGTYEQQEDAVKPHKKVAFVCVPRASANARRMLREANKDQVVRQLPEGKPSFIEPVPQPSRCIAY